MTKPQEPYRSKSEELVYLETMKTEIERIWHSGCYRRGVKVCMFALDWEITRVLASVSKVDRGD